VAEKYSFRDFIIIWFADKKIRCKKTTKAAKKKDVVAKCLCT